MFDAMSSDYDTSGSNTLLSSRERSGSSAPKQDESSRSFLPQPRPIMNYVSQDHSITQARERCVYEQTLPSSLPTTSAFLLGIHNFKALDNINLPEFVKEHQATLTFPEKLMLMLTYVDKEYRNRPGKPSDETSKASISWILDGRAFVIRSKEDLAKHLLPMFFRETKFASFTRKLYRWGFRQVSVQPEDDGPTSRREMVFGHELFQRDNKSQMANMRSVTAAGTRRAIAAMSLKQLKPVSDARPELPIQPRKVSTSTVTAGDKCTQTCDVQTSESKSCHNDTKDSESMSAFPLPTHKEQTANFPVFFPAVCPLSVQQAVQLSHDQQRNQILCYLASQHHAALSSLQGTTSIGSNAIACAAVSGTPEALPDQQKPFETENEAGSVPVGNESSDPNAHMHAAVDLLLRFAS